jgi:hypothetical protein
MVTWTAARAAQQQARPARVAGLMAASPGVRWVAAPQLFADGALNLAFMCSASPRTG